jgi:hypothetical protein
MRVPAATRILPNREVLTSMELTSRTPCRKACFLMFHRLGDEELAQQLGLIREAVTLWLHPRAGGRVLAA